MRLLVVIFISALSISLGSCRKTTATDAVSSLATTDSSALKTGLEEVARLKNIAPPANSADSLSYLLGMSEGKSMDGFLRGVPEEVRDSIAPDSYLLGVYASMVGDTVTRSYTNGVKAVDQIVRYLAVLESKGLKINRKVMAARMIELLNDPGIEIDRAYADSITNDLIIRNFK